MAKGNDGNYLQHSIEIESAVRLAKMDAAGRLHIALTHGMGPFESCKELGSHPEAYRLFKQALNASKEPGRSDESQVITAYRKTKASRKCYPNSAELLRAVIGADKLSGGITEVDCKEYKKLADAWFCSSVEPVCSSWRKQIHPGGILACPGALRTPWLFTMDPMTYSENGEADDDKLHKADIDRLSCVLTGYVQSGKPGIAALFVYGCDRTKRCRFWKFMDKLAKRIGAATCSYWLTHRGGNRNLAGLLYSGVELPADFAPGGLKVGRCEGGDLRPSDST